MNHNGSHWQWENLATLPQNRFGQPEGGTKSGVATAAARWRWRRSKVHRHQQLGRHSRAFSEELLDHWRGPRGKEYKGARDEYARFVPALDTWMREYMRVVQERDLLLLPGRDVLSEKRHLLQWNSRSFVRIVYKNPFVLEGLENNPAIWQRLISLIACSVRSSNHPSY